MDVNPTRTTGTGTGATTKTAAATDEDEKKTSGGALAGDFETFLKLLTTQMRNQDPLKPMDSTEFVAQLASFSAVEQQVRSNDKLESILDVLSGGNSAGLAQWIGRDVRVAAKAAYAGAPVEVAVEPAEGADTAVLVVKNDFGAEVARVAVPPGTTDVTWDGTTSTGAAAAHGNYGFTLESFADDKSLGTSPGKVYSKVQEVRVVDGSPVLVVADGTQVPVDEVSGLR